MLVFNDTIMFGFEQINIEIFFIVCKKLKKKTFENLIIYFLISLMAKQLLPCLMKCIKKIQVNKYCKINKAKLT